MPQDNNVMFNSVKEPMFRVSTILALCTILAGGLVWGLRLEGRVDYNGKHIREALQVQNDRIDRAERQFRLDVERVEAMLIRIESKLDYVLGFNREK